MRRGVALVLPGLGYVTKLGWQAAAWFYGLFSKQTERTTNHASASSSSFAARRSGVLKPSLNQP
jgi:hypothetical protein